MRQINKLLHAWILNSSNTNDHSTYLSLCYRYNCYCYNRIYNIFHSITCFHMNFWLALVFHRIFQRLHRPWIILRFRTHTLKQPHANRQHKHSHPLQTKHRMFDRAPLDYRLNHRYHNLVIEPKYFKILFIVIIIGMKLEPCINIKIKK